MSGGWIKLWRQIRENELWRQRRRFSKVEAWIDLLMDAAFEDHEAILGNTVVPVKRGQALISQRDKAKQWAWSRNTVSRFISVLEMLQMLSHEMSRGPEGGYTLLTILNYNLYQGSDSDAELDEVSHGLSHGRATLGPRLEQSEEGKEGKEGIADAPPASAGGAGKGPGPGKKPRKTHPDTDRLLTEFGVLYRQKFETDYLASFARDKKMLHDMLNLSGAEEVRARMTVFLKYGTKWTRERGNYSIPAFRLAWNELGVLKARGDL